MYVWFTFILAFIVKPTGVWENNTNGTKKQ